MDLLSVLIFAPFLAIFLILLLPNSAHNLYRNIAFCAALIQFVVSLVIFSKFDQSNGKLQLIEKLDWITINMQSFGYLSIDYHVGIDGLNLALILLSSFIFVIGIIASWNLKENSKAYFSLYLLLTSSVLGCFLAIDLFLFFLFFEFMLLPMYFLIGLWGGPRKEYAAIKFFLYTLAGSIFILIAMVALSLSAIEPYETGNKLNITGKTRTDFVINVQNQLELEKIPTKAMVHTLDIIQLSDKKNYIKDRWLSYENQNEGVFSPRSIVFLLLLIGFLIKVPSFPVHTWLPDAHVEASTPISVILAALLLKTGAYGILRIAYTILPDQAINYAWLVASLGVISIIYAAYNALAMNDLKKMIAYSSISHMGFVILGIAAVTTESITGAVFQMVSHGIISAGLFLIVGVLYDRTHNRNIDSYRGLASKMPIFTTITVITFFASLGLPGFSGFIGEVLILLGAFAAHTHNGLISRWYAAIATFGILLSGAYYLWTLQRMFFGKFWVKNGATWSRKLSDLSLREKIVLFPLTFLMIVFGLFPHLILNIINPSAEILADFIINR